jgi:transglutaminase-like putative cysteine protease
MRFHVVHKLMSYLLAVAAVGTLLCTGTVPLATTALLLCAGVLSWFVEPGTSLGRLLDRAGLVFNVGALAFFAVSLFDVIRSFPEPDLTPILNLVLFLLVYKLYHRRTNRDYLQLYILSFLVVLAGAWLAQTVLFVVGFAIYVVLATWTLILFHLRHEIEDNYLVKHLPESATEKVTAARVLNSRRVVGRSFFLVTGLVSLAVMIGAGMVFAAIPRIGIGFLSGTVRRRMSFVGFSDEVKLGQHGILSSDNDTVVLRVQVPGIAALTTEAERDRAIGGLYWRGTVYDRYIPPVRGREADGGSEQGQWVRTRMLPTRTLSRGIDLREGGNLHMLLAPESAKPDLGRKQLLAGTEMQTIQVVGLSFPVAFALDRPVAFESKPPPVGSFVTTDFVDRWSGEVALRPMRLGPRGSVPVAEFSGGQYVAYSRLRASFGDGFLPTSQVKPELLKTYLDVPQGISQEIRDLAARITAGQILPMAKVVAVTEWLRKNKHYTTDLKRSGDVLDPLDDFLFHQDAGHCEYFASATVILLRSAGVPTRYINGFLGGEWNDFGKHITVRENRAHSWAEAYVGTFGWTRVDATPVAGRISRMGRLRQMFDSVELFWNRWILQYDASRQLDLAKRLGRQLGMARPAGTRRPAWKPDLKVAGGLVAAGGLALVLWRMRRRVRRTQASGSARTVRGRPPIFRLYARTVDRLAGYGWPRRPSETPDEYAARLVQGEVPGAEVMRRLTRHYAAARYGEREIPDEVLAELASSVLEVARTRPAAPAPRA